jgi:hypothetical protein
MRRPVTSLILLVAIAAAALTAQTPAALTVVSAGPVGEMRQLGDANEIRVIFSEPMVTLGRIPTNPTPPWIRIEPTMAGAWRWSGTTILIFTPDPGTPVPFATPYTVTVDASAASAAGRRLAAPYTFTFTTPTVRLTSARWARQGTRFDSPVTVALTFNQPVRAADVVAHVTGRFRPHDINVPSITPAERARMAAIDPAGPARYDPQRPRTHAAHRRTPARSARTAAMS